MSQRSPATTTRRRFLKGSLMTAGMSLVHARPLRAASANEQFNLGVIGCGSRGGQLLSSFSKIEGVRIGGLCDPDSERLAKARADYPTAKVWSDLRGLLDDPELDAVAIATCNHWHCLAAIWAMQAGKDVYVEKPLSHSPWEGRQVIQAAQEYERICQVGTQQRSDPMQAEIKTFLHQDKQLGPLQWARVNRFGIRKPIGKRSTPLQIPSTLDYDLWLGPAADDPMHRDELQYDWHWVWNTGNGEMGNWGVHVLDDVRNTVLQDRVATPRKIIGGGGRFVWGDAGETPNLQFAGFETDEVPVLISLCNLPARPGGDQVPTHPGPASGYIAYCEGGRLEGQRGSARAFDAQGKLIRRFKGDKGSSHQRNFVDAVRSRDPSILNAPLEIGHYSTNWCHLANIAAQMGGAAGPSEPPQALEPQWQEITAALQRVVAAHPSDATAVPWGSSPILEFDSESERFVGAHRLAANRLLRRPQRAGFQVPEITRPA